MVGDQEITKISDIHSRHCERSVAIHDFAPSMLTNYGLQPRDDKGMLHKKSAPSGADPQLRIQIMALQ